MFAPARLPYIPPQPPDLGDLCSTPDEEVVSRPRPAAAAPPALTRVGLLNLVAEVDPYRCVPQKELVVVADQRLHRAAGLLFSKVSS